MLQAFRRRDQSSCETAALASAARPILTSPRVLPGRFGLDPRRVPAFGISSADAMVADRYAFAVRAGLPTTAGCLGRQAHQLKPCLGLVPRNAVRTTAAGDLDSSFM